jgi:hypothetical protein
VEIPSSDQHKEIFGLPDYAAAGGLLCCIEAQPTRYAW